MEKVSGNTLDCWVQRHSSRPDAVLDLFERVLGAVDYLHHRPSPFLHLDLKPDNILVRSTPDDAQPVLIDFGIARRSGSSGLKAFTPPYGAPEQERSGRLDAATDVYALGQILRETLAALAPAMPADIAAAVAAVAQRAAQIRGRDRYADAGQMRLALRQARRQAAVEPRRPRKWSEAFLHLPRRAWLAGAAALAITAAIVVALALSSGDEAAPPAKPAEVAVGGAGHTGPSSDEGSFAELRYQFEQALVEGRPDAAFLYRQAREASDQVVEGSEAWRHMKSELDRMADHLSRVQGGGPDGEQIRALLRQKHLTNPRP